MLCWLPAVPLRMAAAAITYLLRSVDAGCDLLGDEARYGEDALDRRVHWLLPTQGYLQHNCRT